MWSAARLIDVIGADDVVFAQVAAQLYFDQLEVTLPGFSSRAVALT